MDQKKIFLSYRRGDRPGYVARLEDELERHFGQGRAFRDVDDIAGGTSWREVIDQNLREAGALLLIIGPRWETIWEERRQDPENYVVYELEQARQMDIPVIPVTLEGTEISKGLELGQIAWLRDTQSHDISDKQGRWASDVAVLFSLLEKIDTIGKPGDYAENVPGGGGPAKGHNWKVLFGVAGAAVIGLLLVLLFQPEEAGTGAVDLSNGSIPTEIESEPAATVAVDTAREDAAASRQYPDISGTWKSRVDDTYYLVSQAEDGSFTFVSPGYGNGKGRFFERMPRKFNVQMDGIGRGEFSVSSDGVTAIGWFLEKGSSQQVFDTLVKVE